MSMSMSMVMGMVMMSFSGIMLVWIVRLRCRMMMNRMVVSMTLYFFSGKIVL